MYKKTAQTRSRRNKWEELLEPTKENSVYYDILVKSVGKSEADRIFHEREMKIAPKEVVDTLPIEE